MICPYVQSSCISVQQNIPNEDNPEEIKQYRTFTFWTNMECPKEKCGVWFKGRCRYKEQQ